MDSILMRELTEQFNMNREHWDIIVKCMTEDNLITESQIDGIPDDVWSWAKRCVSQNDEALILWFHSNIPAFYGEKPIDFIKLEDGTDILKELMLKLPN